MTNEPWPSPFPDDDSLGLPSWCRRAPELWPSPAGHGDEIDACLAVAFAPSLTPAGRRFMAIDLHQNTRWGKMVSPWRLDMHVAAGLTDELSNRRGNQRHYGISCASMTPWATRWTAGSCIVPLRTMDSLWQTTAHEESSHATPP